MRIPILLERIWPTLTSKKRGGGKKVAIPAKRRQIHQGGAKNTASSLAKLHYYCIFSVKHNMT